MKCCIGSTKEILTASYSSLTTINFTCGIPTHWKQNKTKQNGTIIEEKWNGNRMCKNTVPQSMTELSNDHSKEIEYKFCIDTYFNLLTPPVALRIALIKQRHGHKKSFT